ncbi:MAG: hypothetical protein QOG53_2183 [Frankiales bacterium]|nr:hypothetical protein [Frankiales bacterium]
MTVKCRALLVVAVLLSPAATACSADSNGASAFYCTYQGSKIKLDTRGQDRGCSALPWDLRDLQVQNAGRRLVVTLHPGQAACFDQVQLVAHEAAHRVAVALLGTTGTHSCSGGSADGPTPRYSVDLKNSLGVRPVSATISAPR